MTDKIQKIWEKHQRDLNLDTFRENNELHPDFWDDFNLKNEFLTLKINYQPIKEPDLDFDYFYDDDLYFLY